MDKETKKLEISNNVIDFARERYVEEQQRHQHLENKGVQFLRALTVVIGVFAALSSAYVGFDKSPVSGWDWLIALVMFFAGAALFSAWVRILWSLRIGSYKTPANNRAVFDYLLKTPSDQSSFILDSYIDARQFLTTDLEAKVKCLEIAFNEIAFAAWAIFLLLILIIVKIWGLP